MSQAMPKKCQDQDLNPESQAIKQMLHGPKWHQKTKAQKPYDIYHTKTNIKEVLILIV